MPETPSDGNPHPWPRRVDSLARQSSSKAPSNRSEDGDISRSSSRKWKPSSWLHKHDRSSTPSRRTSTSTTSSSTVSASTISSACTASSGHFDIYRLPEDTSDLSSIDGEEEDSFDTVDDATTALAALAVSGLEDDRPKKNKQRESATRQQSSLPPHMRRSESRASSSFSQRSIKPRDCPSESAEIEMISREYQGYWRPSFTSKLPSAAAICGSMLLTARLPAVKADDSKIVSDNQLKEQAHSLCVTLETAEDPDEALGALHAHNLESAIVALRTSLNNTEVPMVPEKTSWAMYQKIAQAKTRPEKLPDLWPNIAKLLKKVPQETLVVIMFLLTIARRLRSRGLTIDGRSPAAYLLQGLWPRYLGDDMSKLLLLHFDEIPPDSPVTIESVNYRFSGRRCNLLALVASRKGTPEQGIREIRASEDRHAEW